MLWLNRGRHDENDGGRRGISGLLTCEQLWQRTGR